MTTPAELRTEIVEETDRIWMTEPVEVRRMRLGIFPTESGSEGQYFTNMVFINGDMRALSTWITPGVIVRALADDAFSLDHVKKLFEWTNLVSVDFLAFTGFVRFAEFAHRIVGVFDQIETKEELESLLKAWYAYANRMYLWVHHMFPWALGTAFPKPTADDLEFMSASARDREAIEYFEQNAHRLAEYASTIKE